MHICFDGKTGQPLGFRAKTFSLNGKWLIASGSNMGRWTSNFIVYCLGDNFDCRLFVENVQKEHQPNGIMEEYVVLPKNNQASVLDAEVLYRTNDKGLREWLIVDGSNKGFWTCLFGVNNLACDQTTKCFLNENILSDTNKEAYSVLKLTECDLCDGKKFEQWVSPLK